MLIRADRDDVIDPLKEVICLRLLCPVLSFMVGYCRRPMQRDWEENKTKFTFLFLLATKKLSFLEKIFLFSLFQQSSSEMGITAVMWQYENF